MPKYNLLHVVCFMDIMTVFYGLFKKIFIMRCRSASPKAVLQSEICFLHVRIADKIL